ncbi:hypothetical protein BAY32_12520 [Elizabethkingia ursingii]|jgi:hypothetical protein|uniref:Uncharacterized protein n=1 Tax=Elizabethkingia ursingii TaxID=1756150 RepID=A0AAJ3NB43_9FLAO|nr:hypothetical protein BBD34_03705 [Elizabethkingia ursingii]OPB73847.1 hypothetical protein BAY32_12520 [Elizabethkingia ursingii]
MNIDFYQIKLLKNYLTDPEFRGLFLLGTLLKTTTANRYNKTTKVLFKSVLLITLIIAIIYSLWKIKRSWKKKK